MDEIVTRVRQELAQKYGPMMVQWYEAVDWQEPLVVGLIGFHVLLLIAVLGLRHVYSAQVVLFGTICGLVAVAERLNTWAHSHWRLFATQNYFDKNGVFMAIFVSGPLLAIGFVQLVSNLHAMAHLVVSVKRHEYKQELLSKKEKAEKKTQ
ncbi:hypothetical protein SPRG_03013 [Saprolegnia parasitica CBS 223.65]|uniref:Uncharacterized protein n=1 Tax=Saprolegnia parasitica (strain CBS 223.65) TaxID=695850 RepID=A0A067CPU1_SAPPC|nr:hypothetical protein SPRG_03013 [Saprolegnia parasitica CBS 223.65]KDO32538.1 hypothetical protein SPRG_03013 [Saprolegnia parasitica CBS 223.65]|eukprot:XP_012196984.1 hypothetical protein SPRG_03013 [Saprolegnia parasitica CBS 223.65]